HVNRSLDLGGRRLRRRALARGLLWLRARQTFRDAVEPAGGTRRAILGLGRGLGRRLGRGLLRRLLLGRCGRGALDGLGRRGRRGCCDRFGSRGGGGRLGFRRRDGGRIFLAQPRGGRKIADLRRGRRRGGLGDQVDLHRRIVEAPV